MAQTPIHAPRSIPGSAGSSRNCPACGNDKSYFIGPICGDCYAAGKEIPPDRKEGSAVSVAGQRFECPNCHQMKSNLSEHNKFCKGPQSKAPAAKAQGGVGSTSRALPARRGAHAVARKTPKRRDGAAMGAARITVELQAMMEDCQRAIELVGLAARRIEGREAHSA